MVTLQKAVLRWVDGDPATEQYDYVIYGALDVEEDVSQNAVQMSPPFGSAENALLASFFGQKERLNCSFLIMPRSDDYTDGGSDATAAGYPDGAAPHDVWEQKDYLKQYILKTTGKQQFEDETGATMDGRISNLRIRRTSDDPISFTVQFQFLRGNALGVF